jgi:oleandomycin transport system ATP-binding protein
VSALADAGDMTKNSELAIAASGLTKRFGSTQALDGVDLLAPAGTILGVLGPNGAGKTTAVRILATLLRPDAGDARVGGLDVVREADAVRRMIGLTGQYASVDEALTGTRNLVLIGRLLDLSRRAARARAKELLAWFGLTEAADRPARTYSDACAGAWTSPPASSAVPPSSSSTSTTGLDPAKREDMWGVVRSRPSSAARR